MRNDSVCTRVALALLLLPGAGNTLAHHSTSAEFDQNKPLTFTGTVKRVLWTNPHIYTHVEAMQPDGSTFIYHVEGGSPNTLFRQGWRRESVQVGETVTVTGWRAKNPQSPNVGQATITTANGQRIYSGNAPARTP